MNKPLVSLIILSYKNYHYIYEALDSVLCQDYPNIEIVISNDGSSDFDKKEIEIYLNKNKKNNIKNFIINNNEINIGTVKNINKAIKFSNGKYIIMFAADDTMYDCKVISKLLSTFDNLPKKELVVISQVGMYDIKLKKLIQPFLSNEDIKRIKTLTPQKLFAEMSTRCIVPGCGICYKRDIFKKYGYFDERYVLVEDFSYALKLSRLGVKYNYADFISVKHRDGGISHGNINGESQKSKQYELDIVNILKHEVLPYIKMLDKKSREIFITKYKDYKWKYAYNFVYKDKEKAQRRKAIKDNFSLIFHGFIKDFAKDFTDQFKGKKIKLLLLGILIYIIYVTNKINLIKIISLALIYTSIGLIIIFLFMKYIKKLINFIIYIF